MWTRPLAFAIGTETLNTFCIILVVTFLKIILVPSTVHCEMNSVNWHNLSPEKCLMGSCQLNYLDNKISEKRIVPWRHVSYVKSLNLVTWWDLYYFTLHYRDSVAEIVCISQLKHGNFFLWSIIKWSFVTSYLFVHFNYHTN